MHPEVKEFADRLQEVSDLMLSVGERRWGEWFRADSNRVRSLDFFGVEHALSAFGGMGSVNDLILHPMNGHNLHESDIENVNEKVRCLLRRIYALGDKLKREEVNATRPT